MNIFSYCIYGTGLKYRLGLLKNIDQILSIHEFNNFNIWIYIGNDIEDTYIKQLQEKSTNRIKTILCEFTGGRLMTQRFFAIDNDDVYCMIVRDADSRFTQTDIYCIHKFLHSSYTIYTIRDHYWHNCPIMGGQWGIKKTTSISINLQYLYYHKMLKEYVWKSHTVDSYNMDEQFLRNYIYTLFGNRFDMIAFSSVSYSFNGTETIEIIHGRNTGDINFCGNVFDFVIDNHTHLLKEIPVFTYNSNG